MTSSEDTLRALRAALLVSPDNLPLRQHLADTLMKLGQFEEAEQEYRLALSLMPENQFLQLNLASVFYQQGKNSQSMVLVENLLKSSDPPAFAHLLYARLLLHAGDATNAAAHFHIAVVLDPEMNDPMLAARLGITDVATQKLSVPERRAPESKSPEYKIPEYELDVSNALEAPLEQPSITFQDVGGMDAIKEEIRLKIVHPLAHPEIYQAYGQRIGGGVLMYGPPGCGKTYLARATAGEIKARFLSIGINDVLDMWLGSSEKNLRELFEQARRSKPCVLFFDEVDALAAKRTDMRYSSGRQIVNQFLAELDGVESPNDGILVLAATNAPWHLDSAFRRPGRFDRIMFVPPPDRHARVNILRILCRHKPVEDIDYDYLSKKTASFSGADLKAVVDLAVDRKLQAAIQQGIPKPLATKDFLAAIELIHPSVAEWFATARSYATYANENGIYDDILHYVQLETKGRNKFF
ncbi:AAA family ATPase [Chroococcidiopsis sp. SAG 2025]|uniref:AAA family ATPase n=1 Tax=Chroococcidiopsis sp. SAG 2025 TaxID=171389 RepID=UPI00293700C0|nr:AAA family ATPase [Chroococcidiopsis sp. SAG 2025]